MIFGLGAAVADTLVFLTATNFVLTLAATSLVASFSGIRLVLTCTLMATPSARGTLLLLAEDTLKTSCLVSTASVFVLLQICQTTCLSVDVLYLAGAVAVEVDQLLAGRGVGLQWLAMYGTTLNISG
jgi:hypothetical protein